jgi:hypothetical protein
MAANISDWRTEVGYYVKGPDTTLTDWAVVEALRDFCGKTGMWRYRLARINVVADTQDYSFTAITTDGDNDLDSIVWAKYKQNGDADDQFTDLEIIEGDWEEQLRRGAWEFQDSTTPARIMVVNESTAIKKFRLHPTPTVASTSGLLIKVQVKPSVGATTVPQFIFDDYHKGIAHATASILQNMTNKPWSNKDHAKDNWNQYTKVRANALNDRIYGRGKRSMSVRPRFWAGSRYRTLLRRF